MLANAAPATNIAIKHSRIATLDGLRGIAILLVLVVHLEVCAFPWAHLLPRAFLVVSRNLFIGVDLFFVLSGYLITGILLKSKTDPTGKAMRSFYARRVLRIFPLYYSACVLVFWLLPRLSGNGAESHWRTLSYAAFLSNWVQAWIGVPMGGFLTVAWSLAIEEQFYLIWPWIVRSLSIHTLQRTCLAIVAISPLARLCAWMLGANMETLYVLTPLRLDGLAAGAWLAVYLHSRTQSTRSDFTIATRTVLICGGLYGALAAASFLTRRNSTLFAMGFFRDQPMLFTIGFSVAAIGFSALTYLALHASGLLQKSLSYWTLTIFGKFSFSLYLLHVLIGYYLSILFLRLGLVGHGSSFLVYVVVFGASVLGAAWLTWTCIEKPALRLKRFFPY